MWPQALQMTRDECRGILRRLELESYSQVISVFRAQGGLSDAKAKLLEELRGIFHISNERHRAEARRVANDEQLATIAEAISGPNTWQEWSREGRRPYPMLPRVAPQTALALIANNVAGEAAQENLKLPYPAETAEVVKEEQQQIENQKSLEAASERNNYVVTNDPFKMPEIPSNHKKNLKRNINSDHQNSGLPKKRSTGDSVGQQNILQAGRRNYPHITANSPQINSSSSTANMSERKQKQSAIDLQNNQHILKQRFFHQQHQITKQKMAKKAAAAAAAAASNVTYSGSNPQKRQATPAKSGRRANQKIHQQQKQNSKKQLQVEGQQQQQQIQIDLTGGAASNAQTILTQQQIDMQFVTYATHHQPPQQIFMEKEIELTQPQIASLPAGPMTTAGVAMSLSTPPNPPSLITPLSLPQMAISKRDISKNANKLLQNQQSASNISPSLPSMASMPSQDVQTGLSNILSSSTTSAQLSSDKSKSSEKSLITTTPVQKYIVEERQPGAGAIVNLQNSHGSTSSTGTTTTTHIIQVSNAGQQPQIMSLPQFSAAATKLRAVNTTLIAPGAKITSTPTKKISSNLSSSSGSTVGSGSNSSINAGALHELANVASTQSQVLHIVDDGANNNPTNVPHTTPLHTPPAVIQIHNTSGVSASTTSDISTASNQSKVLTTKILPLVLAGSGNHQNNANNSLINNSTLVVASSPASSVSITSSTSTAGGATIIKNLPSTMVLNTSTANLTPITVTSTNNTIISTLGAGATVFRKPPNIIKTSVATSTPTKNTSPSSAPHIISNVKLTPVSVSPSSTVTHITTPSTFKNVIPSTSGMVRTNVKICQSPNVKVFIQPANLADGPKMKFSSNSVSHKIISSSSTGNSSKTTGSGQRIAIQKVQIFPASMGSPASGNVIQSAGNHINTKTGKSNMIFMPTSVSNVRPVTLSKMGSNILLKSSSNQQITPTSPTTITADNTISKSNIVVLGPSLTTPVKEQNLKLENTQLINEDTPLDILNMPIVMDPGVSVTSPSSAAETVTVLPSNIIDTSNVNTASALATPIILDQTQINPSKTVVLNVDWEMKLDIEQQNQYNNKNLKQKRTFSSSSGNQPMSPSISSHGNKLKNLNNDLISLEIKPKESNSTIVSSEISTVVPITTANSTKNMIVLDDSFDDVIVEEHDDDSSSITSVDKNQQRQNQNIDNDTPKILDMQIYQQHDGHNNKLADLKSTKANDDDIVVVEDIENEKQQSRQFLQTAKCSRTDIEHERQIHNEPHNDPQQLQHSECEIDAGFDETIVTEIDENTAIEYIEEDGVNTNASTISDRNDMQLETSIINDSATTIPTTIISSQDNTKSSNILTITSNDYTLSTTSTEQILITDSTKSNENSSVNATTTTTTVTTNATQELIANNSATQQVEP